MAAVWFSRAAEQGEQDAQAKLASLYETGRGVPRDLSLAYMWRLLCCRSHNPELRKFAATMSPEDIDEREGIDCAGSSEISDRSCSW